MGQYETTVPTVAQTVVARHLEAKVEPVFHPDSYGYRPSALDAVAACRRRCWRYVWVNDLDIQKFFDTVPWDLVVKAVEAHIDAPWVLLYVNGGLPYRYSPTGHGPHETETPHRGRAMFSRT